MFRKATDDRAETPASNADDASKAQPPPPPKRSRLRRWGRRLLYVLLILVVILVAARLSAGPVVRWYVNRALDGSTLYEGRIGEIDIHLWRGAYTIHDIRFIKRNAQLPVPLFAAKQVDLALEWKALRQRKLVGRITIDAPELNFVDAPDESEQQTGAGGPWLQIIRDLFPFKINSAEVHNGQVHFHAFATNPPVDVYLSDLEASIENLTNIRDETTPFISTVRATATAMESAQFQYEMKFDPFSYKPSFDLAVRLLGMDCTKLNALTQAYGAFDFERGWFDLVIEMQSREGLFHGYVKPLFRNLKVLGHQDLKEENVLQVFWEALIGTVAGILKNPPREQFGTVIPMSGSLDSPKTDILSTLGNVLRNAFVRAYMPQLQGVAPGVQDVQFGPGSAVEATTVDTRPQATLKDDRKPEDQ